MLLFALVVLGFVLSIAMTLVFAHVREGQYSLKSLFNLVVSFIALATALFALYMLISGKEPYQLQVLFGLGKINDPLYAAMLTLFDFLFAFGYFISAAGTD